MKQPFFNRGSSFLIVLAWTLPLAAQSAREPEAAPAAPAQPAVGKNPFADVPASHKQLAAVTVHSSDGKYKLQTIGLDGSGRVLALTAPPRTFGAPLKNVASELFIYTPDGKPVTSAKLAFHANAVAADADGNIFVAGEGKVAKLSKEGKPLATLELPHLTALLKDTTGIRKQAEEQLQLQRESMKSIVKTYQERLDALEKKKAADRTKLEQRQLEQYQQILKSIQQPREGQDNVQVDAYVNMITARLRTISSIAFSSKDVFIVCGDTKGFGYAVWRMDHAFEKPTKVLSGLGGCCGQMDVQTLGTDLLIAENTKHRFARYDRDGKPLGAWGKRTMGHELECFGHCCNPMNLRGAATGDILTSEAEGVIKRFSPKGEFLGVVCAPAMTGSGCRNMAFAISPDEARVYFLDINASRFLILGKK